MGMIPDFGIGEHMMGDPKYASAASEHQQFEQHVLYVMPALERASEQLDDPDSMRTAFDTARCEIMLSHDDWFQLRGLLLCARFGSCTERWPPWFNRTAKRHWLAWKAQGSLVPSEARRRFISKVNDLPGYTDLRAMHHAFDACWTINLPVALPLPCMSAGFSICGLVAFRCSPAPMPTPTLEEAEAARRKSLLTRPMKRGSPGTLDGFCGQWRHLRTENMDAYLRAFGVGGESSAPLWPRIAAAARRPSSRLACLCACRNGEIARDRVSWKNLTSLTKL